MKIEKIIILLLIIVSLQACSQTKSDTIVDNKNSTIQNENEVTSQLKNFYTLYFSEMEKDDVDEKKLDNLLQKNLTSKLYEKIKRINLDYDPIINGQDIDSNWRKTLNVKHISKSDLYEMCTINSFDNSKYCTYLKVEKSSNGYKIYDISINEISSILNYSENNDNQSIDNDNYNIK